MESLSSLIFRNLRGSGKNSRRVSIFILVSLLLPMAGAQIYTMTNATSAPTPGVGHDFIHLLNETVSPANGTVSVNINFPMPKGRGIDLPFSINYNSGQAIVSDPFAVGFYNYSVYTYYNGIVWYANIDLLSTGGWTYGLPFANWATGKVSAQGSYHDPNGQNTYCPNTTGYVFRDMSGGSHPLYLGAAGSTSSNNGMGECETIATQGGDDYFAASITYNPSSVTTLSTPLTVSDLASGTTYNFAGATMYGGGNGVTGLLPYLIEDRNGNQLNVTQSLITSQTSNSDLFAFTFTDTLKRPVLSDTGFPGNSETITADGLSYGITWRTTSANYTVPATDNLSDLGGNCSGVGPVQIPIANGSPLTVISSITLPNKQAYHFYYGDNNPHGLSNPYGLLSEIDYPDGGSVQYTWKLSDQYSDSVVYPSGTSGTAPPGSGTNGASFIPDACQYHYKAPVVATRTVFYSGTTAAATQSFTYATTWNNSNPTPWKTTQVTTTDNVTSKTALKQYTYLGITQGTPPYSQSHVPQQIPVEQTVTTYDWGSTGTPLDVSTKAWYDQYQLACEFHTLNGTTASGHFYEYAPGVQMSDDKSYDFGQIANPASSGCSGVGNAAVGPVPTTPSSPAPLRETTRAFQTFTNPLGTTFSSPQSEIVYGSGAKASETDYGYDGGSLAGANAVMHDEAAFPAGVVANRGNVTSITRQCVYGCGSSVKTTAAYDKTGQMVSSTDGCGNASCSDVSGSNHTTTYVYADSPAGSGGGNTNAYLTQMTDPLGHTQNFTYNYTNGEVTSATDSNAQVTVYTYKDPLNRLTNTADPDGGQTAISYNDSVPSITTTVASSPNPAKSTVAVMDGMGHVTQTQLTTDPSGTDYTDTVYDGTGQVYSVSNPHSSQTLSSDGSTTYVRDALGRITTQTQPDTSTQTYTYAGNIITFVDEVSNTWKRTSDALGRLTQVVEPGNLETDYGYDGLDNLTSSVQHGTASESARSRNFSYDSLSRLVTSTNPETGTICYGSTGSGSCQNGYDANGNLGSKTDARGVVTQYSYDALNRLISKVYTNAPAGSLSSCYQYDAATNGVGRLAASWTQAGSCPAKLPTTGFLTSRVYVTYDAVGRLQQQQQCVPGKCAAQSGSPFTMNYAYDLAGNTTSMDDGLGQVSWALSYDGAGRLSTVTGAAAPGIPNPAQLFANPAYNPANQLTKWSLGAIDASTPALTGTRTYDNRLRVTTETVAGHD